MIQCDVGAYRNSSTGHGSAKGGCEGKLSCLNFVQTAAMMAEQRGANVCGLCSRNGHGNLSAHGSSHHLIEPLKSCECRRSEVVV